MAYDPEVAEQLKEWGLTPEELAQLEPTLGKPERQEKIKGSALRQAEFSRKMQALDRQKSEALASIAEKEEQARQYAAELGGWKSTADKKILDAQAALEEERVKAYRLEQRMLTLAAQQGVDPKTWGLDGAAQPPEPKKEPDKLDDRYVSREEAEKLRREMSSSPFVASTIHDLDVKHRELFGKPLAATELLTETLKWNKSHPDEQRDMSAQWEAMNEVSKKRQEIQEQEIQRKIDERVAEERNKILSEHKLPVSRGSDTGSPILSMRDNLKLAGTDRSKSDSASAVDAAVAAFNKGTYRGAVQPAEKTA